MPAPSAASAETEAADAARRHAVLGAVDALPLRQRSCVLMHYFEGLSDAEVADTLGVSVGSVKTHLHRARAALAVYLEDER